MLDNNRLGARWLFLLTLPALLILAALAATGTSANKLTGASQINSDPLPGTTQDVEPVSVAPHAPYATTDAFLFLTPGSTAGSCPAPPNGGSVAVNCRFVLDMMINMGNNPDGAAQQSYLTFTYGLIQNASVSAIGSSCTVTNTVTADTCGVPGCSPGDPTGFEVALQNEVCNGPGQCSFRGLIVDPGSLAYASGALSNPVQGGVFRVAQVGLCATAPGQAILHWEFSPPAHANRDTEIVVADGSQVRNSALFTDYTFCVGAPGSCGPTPTNTRTITRVPPTNTRTNTATPTLAPATAMATGTFTNTPTPAPPTNTPTLTNTPACGPVTYVNTDAPRAIPDNGTIRSLLSIPDGPIISQIEVVNANFGHTFPADLDVFLVSPSGTRVELFTDVCSSLDWTSANTGFTLSSSGSRVIGSVCPPGALTYRPEGSLNDLIGQASAGTWTLEVTDDRIGDTGTLNGWGLRVTGNSTCGTVTPTPTGTYTPVATATGTTTLPTSTPTNTATRTRTPITAPTLTPTNTPPLANTPTNTRTVARTSTPIVTPTVIRTNTPTITPTMTDTNTVTSTPTNTPCPGSSTIQGAITTGDLRQRGRLPRDHNPSQCGTIKPCPTLESSSLRYYDAYSFSNTTDAAQCVTINLTTACSGANDIYSVAYLETYHSTRLCINYIGDIGYSPGEVSGSSSYSISVPAGATYVVVVHEITPGAGCSAYTLNIETCQ